MAPGIVLSNFGRILSDDDDDDDMCAVEYTASDDEIETVEYHNEYLDTDLIADLRRQGRKWEAELFRNDYTYGPSKERKTCVWSGGSTRSWPDISSGIIWVGVLGPKTACVVTRVARYLDVTRAKRRYKYMTKEMVLRRFMEAAISEMEDLELEEVSSELFGHSFKRPFGVVSGIPCIHELDTETECGHEGSSDEDEINSALGYDDSIWKQLLEEVNSGRPPREYDATKLVGFIQEKMKSDPTCFFDETLEASSVECGEDLAVDYLKRAMRCDAAFDVDETIQVAITAFQHLFQKKFEANEIEVSVVDPAYYITWEEAQSKGKHGALKELETSDIKNYLDIINDEPGSGGSSRSSSEGSSRSSSEGRSRSSSD